MSATHDVIAEAVDQLELEMEPQPDGFSVSHGLGNVPSDYGRVHDPSDFFSVTVEGFGLLPYHAADQPDLAIPVKRYTLCNEKGMMVQVLNYGVTITAIRVPDRKGDVDDIVLGFDDLDSYVLHAEQYMGCCIGRVADRISRGRFQLDHQVHDLTRNLWNKLHFHGGNLGFSQCVWNSRVEGHKVIFTDLNPHLEEGYPGNLMTTIKLWLTNDNGLKIVIEAVADVPTPVSITNHTCFNLAGHRAGAKALGEHVVVLNADKYLVSDDHSIPTGEVKHVGCTKMDLRIHRLLSRVLPNIPGGIFKHNYCVNGGRHDGVRFVARLLHPKSGRVMELFSNQPVVHFQTSLIYEEEPVQDVVQEVLEEVVEKAVPHQEAGDDEGEEEEAEEEEEEEEDEEVRMGERASVSETLRAMIVDKVMPTEKKEEDDEVMRMGERASVSEALRLLIVDNVIRAEDVWDADKTAPCDEPKVDRRVHGKGGAIYDHDGCFSLMSQGYPDAVNKRHFPDVILRPGEVYNHTLLYKFSTVKKTKKVVQEAVENSEALPPLEDPFAALDNESVSVVSNHERKSSKDAQESANNVEPKVHRPESADTFNFSKEKIPPVYPPFE